MSPSEGNLALLQRVATRITPLLDEVVLVGGCAVDLLVTDPGSPAPRVTMDVDLTAEVSSDVEYSALADRLTSLGFNPGQVENDPICRFRDPDGLVVDLMPSAPEVLGFGSRWYRQAITYAWEYVLPSRAAIRCITAPLFLASKLEAFRSRGQEDYMASRDLEDVVYVVNGREIVTAEVSSSNQDVKAFVTGEITRLITNDEFKNALPGLIADDESRRLAVVWQRFENLAHANS